MGSTGPFHADIPSPHSSMAQWKSFSSLVKEIILIRKPFFLLNDGRVAV